MSRHDDYLISGSLRRVQVITVKGKPEVDGALRRVIERGGPGSGHRAHKGRPGEVGGSLPSTAGTYVGIGGGKGQRYGQYSSLRDAYREALAQGWIPDPEQEGVFTGRITLETEEGTFSREQRLMAQELRDQWFFRVVYEKTYGQQMPAFEEPRLRIPEAYQMEPPSAVETEEGKLFWPGGEQPEWFIKFNQNRIKAGLDPVTPAGLSAALGIAGFGVETGATGGGRRRRVPSPFGTDVSAFASRGGPGSGHHGHRGRQGEVGGSMPGAGYGAPSAQPTMPGFGRQPRAKRPAGTAVSGLADLEPGDSQTVAQYYQSQAEQSEPALTEMMQTLAELSGGNLTGLEHAVKSAESLQNKIERDMLEKGISAQEAASEINDRNRYTLVLNDEAFVENVQRVQAELEKQGWSQYDEKYKNFFASGDNYDGYNTVVIHESGQRFELQFHTEDSLRIKEQVHPIYEKFRETRNTADRRVLWQQMADAYATAEQPPGWENLPGRQVVREKPGEK